jgi:putative addiction module antidote
MTHKTTVRPIGASSGVILPKEVVEEMNVGDGDEIVLVRTERGYEMVPCTPDSGEMWAIYRQGARKYLDALRDLAK